MWPFGKAQKKLQRIVSAIILVMALLLVLMSPMPNLPFGTETSIFYIGVIVGFISLLYLLES